MEKTRKEKQEHQHRIMQINNELGQEYNRWFGVPEGQGIGRYVALGEYITELCEFEGHDSWFDAARDAYQQWKKTHHIKTTPSR